MTVENGPGKRMEDNHDDDVVGDDESTHIHENLNHDMKEEKGELQQRCKHAVRLDSTPVTVASSSVDSKSDGHDCDENHQSIAAIQTPIFSSFQARNNEKGKEHNPVTTPLHIDVDITNCDEKNVVKDENDDGDRDATMKKGTNVVLSSTPSADDEDTTASSAPVVSQPASPFTESAHESASATASKLRKGEEVTIPPSSSSNNEESSSPSHPPTPTLAPTQIEEPSENPPETSTIKDSHTISTPTTTIQSKKSADEGSTRDHGSSHGRNNSNSNSNNTEGSSSQHHDGIFSRLFRKSSARKLSSSMEEAGSDADANADADLSTVVNGASAEAHFSATAEATLAIENSTSSSLNEAENGDNSSNALKRLSYKGGADSHSEEGDLLVSFYGVVKPSQSTNDSDQASETNSWDDLLVDFADPTKRTNESKPLGGEEFEKKEESKAGSNEAESKHEELSSSPEEVDPTPTEDHTVGKVVAAVSKTSKTPSGGPGADTSAAEDDDMLVSFYSKDEAKDLLVSFYGVVKPSSQLGEVVQNNHSTKSQQNDDGKLTNFSDDDENNSLDDERGSLCMSADAIENNANTSLKSNCSDTSNDDEPGDVSISTDNFLPEIMSAADSNSRLGSPTFSIDSAEMESSPPKPNEKQFGQASATFDRMPSDMKVILKDEIIGVLIDEFFDIAWSEGASSSQNDHAVPPLYGPWLTSCGKHNVSVQQWEKVDAGKEHIDSFTHRRGVEFDFEKSTLGVHSKVKVHHEQKYRLTNDQLILHMAISMKGFPYAECFRVEVRHLVNKRRTNETEALDVEVGLKVVFVKSTIIERKIRNNTSEETVKSQSDLLQTIKRACLAEVKRRTFDKKSSDSSSGDAPIETSAESMTAMETINKASIQVEPQPVDEAVVGDASEIKSEDIPIDVTAESNTEISSREEDVEVKRQTASNKRLSESDVIPFDTGKYCSGFGVVHTIGNESADKRNSVEFKDDSVDLIKEPSELEYSVDKEGKVGNSYKIASSTEKTETIMLQGALVGLDTKKGEEAANSVEEASMQQVGSRLADTTGGEEAVENSSVYATRDSDFKMCNREDLEIEVHVNESVEAAKECNAESSSEDKDLSALVIDSPSIINEFLSILISAPQDQAFNIIDSSKIATNMYKKKETNKQCAPLSGLAEQYHSMPATTASIDEIMESNGQCRCFWCPDLLSNLFRGSKPKAAFVSPTPTSNYDIHNMQGSVDDLRAELLALINRGGISPTIRDRVLQEVLVIQQSLDRISSISMNNLDQNVNVQVDDV